jgi:hypothetical protein
VSDTVAGFASSIKPGTAFAPFQDKVKVRIKKTPREAELDGIRLDTLTCGQVREVSASIGSWLIAQGYAEPEMRRSSSEQPGFSGVRGFGLAHDRRRRSSDY